jgi:hypothetical protein
VPSPTTTDITDTASTPTIGARARAALLRGQVLHFRSTSHNQGYLIILPELDEDLTLDLTPLLESIYVCPLYPTSQDENDIDAGLTVVLFEEDEVPAKTWTLTIPRPVGSVLPRTNAQPGQEKERGKGRRREGLFRDISGSGCGVGMGRGGMGWEMDEQGVVVLRHWVSAVWDAYDRWDRYRERWLSSSNEEIGEESGLCRSGNSSGYGELNHVEDDCRTEPRVSSLLKSLSRLNGLLTYVSHWRLLLRDT